MSAFRKSFQAFTVGGILFIFPLIILILLVLKAIHLIKPIVHKLVTTLGIDTVFGTATISVVSIILIVLLCFISGVLLHLGLLKKWNSNFEETLYLLFPPLQRLKFRFFSEEQDSEDSWKSILLKRDESFNIAFVTSSSENGFLSIFIPDAPDITTGEVIYIKESNCTYHHIPRKDAMKMLQHFGKGLSEEQYRELENI